MKSEPEYLRYSLHILILNSNLWTSYLTNSALIYFTWICKWLGLKMERKLKFECRKIFRKEPLVRFINVNALNRPSSLSVHYTWTTSGLIFPHSFLSCSVASAGGRQMSCQRKHVINTWLLIGSVLIWHMYVPQSFIWTLETCSFQVLWPLWVTESRGLWATMCVWMARMALESDLIHATWMREHVSTSMRENKTRYESCEICPWDNTERETEKDETAKGAEHAYRIHEKIRNKYTAYVL